MDKKEIFIRYKKAKGSSKEMSSAQLAVDDKIYLIEFRHSVETVKNLLAEGKFPARISLKKIMVSSDFQKSTTSGNSFLEKSLGFKLSHQKRIASKQSFRERLEIAKERPSGMRQHVKREEPTSIEIQKHIEETPWAFQGNKNTVTEPTKRMRSVANWYAINEFELGVLNEDRLRPEQKELIENYKRMMPEEQKEEKLRLMKAIYE